KRCGHLADKTLIGSEAMSEKIRAAVRARHDKNFLLVARTDARAVEGFESAVRRAQGYLQAGADAIFPEALESAKEFRQFAQQIRAPLLSNMTEFGCRQLLSARTLAAMGYWMG